MTAAKPNGIRRQRQDPVSRIRAALLAAALCATAAVATNSLLSSAPQPAAGNARPTPSPAVPPAPVVRAENGTGAGASTGLGGDGADTVGVASYYADRYHGRPTASGEIFDRRDLTAAHRTLPFGTRVKVTCLTNQRSVIVRINDRGPFVAGRIIDLSPAAAAELGMMKAGLATVRVAVIPTSP